uniref:TRASH domain protein n=1 Tax=Geobacter sp. (strain M21) TaxID=443144 RepID=C6E081_GEOSM
MKILIWVLLGYLVYRIFKGKSEARIAKKEPAAAETFQDPVCGVYISEADAVVGNLAGRRYHFCSMDCLKRFEQIQQQR